MTLHSAQRISKLMIGKALLLLAASALTLMTATQCANSQGGNQVATVSAASFAPVVAPDSIAAAFGSRLATSTQIASSQPLPTTLAGTTVKVNGALAQLFFVSPLQVNFVLPSGTPSGAASVVV